MNGLYCMGEQRKYIARCRGKTHFTGLDIQKIVVVSGPLSSVSGLLNFVSGLLNFVSGLLSEITH